MYIIGITGGTGAGKTSVVKVLQAQGAVAIDCDEVYHELLVSNDEMIKEIKTCFSDVMDGGRINRRKLGEIVWNDPEALHKLNTITHKYVIDEINKRINKLREQGASIVAIDAIALIESGQGKRCNLIVAVSAPQESRVLRIMKRDGISKDIAQARIDAQKPESFYKDNCDYILENTYDTQEKFEEKCIDFFKERMGFVMSNRAETRRKIDDWFEANSEQMIADLGKFIEINSVRSESKDGAPYGEDSRKVLSLAQAMLEERGFDVRVFKDMMIVAEFGPVPSVMGILAHLDIVAAGDGWDTDPLKLVEKDGKLYGRGVIDDKGPSVAAMYALYCARDLFSQFKHGVQLILGSGEETGFTDITQYLKENTPPPNIFTPDAEYPVVNIEKGRFFPVFGAKWEKDTTLPRIVSIVGGKTPNVVPDYAEAVIEGFSADDVEDFCREYIDKTGVYFSVAKHNKTEEPSPCLVTAEGKAAHASKPERGNNAQTALIDMLANMPFAESNGFGYVRALNRLFPHGDNHGTAIGIDMNDDKTGRITVNFGVLRFSEYEFSGNFDSRTPACADNVDLAGKTTAVLTNEGLDVSYQEIIKCHHTPEDSPFVQKLLTLYEEYTGQHGKCKAMGGLTYVHDIEGGVAFGVAMPGDDNIAHGVNEYINKEQLITSAKMFTQAIIDMCVG